MDDQFLDPRLELLTARNKTCILINRETIVYESHAIGVKPLRELRKMNYRKLDGDYLILVDRVIGKGALMLAELLGVDAIFTPLTSQTALDYSKKADIPIYYKELVPFIENRDRTGMCPIENSVRHTDDPVEGEQNIEAAIGILMQQRN